MASIAHPSGPDSPGSEVSPARNEASAQAPPSQVPEPDPASLSLRRSKRRKSAPGEWWANPPTSYRPATPQISQSMETLTRNSSPPQTNITNDSISRPLSPNPPGLPFAFNDVVPLSSPLCEPSPTSDVTDVRKSAAKLTDKIPITPVSIRENIGVDNSRIPSAPRKTKPARSRLLRQAAKNESRRGSAESDKQFHRAPNLSQVTQATRPSLQADRRTAVALARGSQLKFKSISGKHGFAQVATAIAVNSSFIGELRVPGHTSTAERRAVHGDEIYFVQRGLLDCDIDWVRVTLREGDYIAIPHMSCYEFRNNFTFASRLIFFAPHNPSSSTKYD